MVLRSWSERLALEGNIRILVVQALISTLGFGMFVVIWQPYLISEGVSIVEISWIQSVINLSSGVGLIAWGVLSDRYGRKPVIIVSNVCRILAIVALIMSRNLVFLLVYASLLGFSALFMIGNPARSALITESVVSEKRATAFSTLMAFGMIANTITASVGGYLAVTSGYMPILYLAVAGDIIGLILITIFLRETLDQFRALLRRRRGGIKSLLLNQKRIAGIGNVYVQDPLFKAGIHPLRTINTLSDDEVIALWQALRETLQESIDQGGSGWERNLYGEKGRWGERFLLVAYREGKPCPTCGTAVVKIKTGSTHNHICPLCQPLEKG